MFVATFSSCAIVEADFEHLLLPLREDSCYLMWPSISSDHFIADSDIRHQRPTGRRKEFGGKRLRLTHTHHAAVDEASLQCSHCSVDLAMFEDGILQLVDLGPVHSDQVGILLLHGLAQICRLRLIEVLLHLRMEYAPGEGSFLVLEDGVVAELLLRDTDNIVAAPTHRHFFVVFAFF